VGLGLVLLTGGLLTGCGASGTKDARDTENTSAAGSRVGSGTPSSPAATPPEDLCARIVSHWSREVLDESAYGDYQSMGLSNGQYAVLRAVVDAARAEKERDGREAAERLIGEEARTRCEELYRDGGPSGGPWQ
jgi:hypothetical protein